MRCNHSPNPIRRLLFFIAFGALLFVSAAFFRAAVAQQTNPVDRQVTNPMTDTPNINPLTPDQPAVRPRQSRRIPGSATQSNEELTVTAEKSSVTGPKEARVIVYEGNVDARIGAYRLQADKVTVYEETNRVVAEGSVVFDQEGGNRITGTRADFNYGTKLGFFVDSTGFTNETQDGTVLYFTADLVQRVSLDTIVALNAEVTACEENIPKWSFRAHRVEIKTGDRVRLRNATVLVKDTPVMFMPYASVPIKRRDRASGFLSPTFSASGSKGFRLSTAYYQTLGRSADITFRNDIYSARGLGFGAALRTRASSRSFFNAGFFLVKDRIFGPRADATHPNQGGSTFYAEGVHYFPNGFIAAADVSVTSNLAFRQVFSDNIQQTISPDERSTVFLNKDYRDYSFNFLIRNEVTSLPDTRIRIRQFPSVTFDKRPSPLSFLDKLPVYFSFSSSAEGVSRKETPSDETTFRTEFGYPTIQTPSIVQRLDVFPKVSVPFDIGGWTFTATGELRGTFYSNSIDPTTRLVLGRDVVRTYGEFDFDVRPPALERDFHHSDGSFFFRHIIEPYFVYRRIGGISNFDRIILFDYQDAVADTNEIEYGVVNRFFTRRSTESVSQAAARKAARKTKEPSVASQPYEALTVTIRGKYFLDPYFGGALVPGQRNQFYPITTLSGFSYGGVPRRFSPLSLDTRYRPNGTFLTDVRMDFDVQRVGVRSFSTSFGLYKPRLKVFSTFYYTRALKLPSSLSRFADARGLEPGTLRGGQLSPSVFYGKSDHGFYGGVSLFFEFQRPVGSGNSSLVTSTVTAGYAFNCCAVTIQNYTFNVGLRRENRVVFSFRLNGIGTFGTEQIGQPFR